MSVCWAYKFESILIDLIAIVEGDTDTNKDKTVENLVT